MHTTNVKKHNNIKFIITNVFVLLGHSQVIIQPITYIKFLIN